MRPGKVSLLALAGLLAASGAMAEESGKAAPKCDTSKGAPAEQSTGKLAPRMVVTIDRETGRIRPATAEERAALAAAGGRRILGRTGEATTVEIRADGSLHARLGPEYFRWSVARVNPDGSVSYECLPASRVKASEPPAPSASPAKAEK